MVHGLITLGDLDGLQKFTPPRFDWAQLVGPINKRMPALLWAIHEGVLGWGPKQDKCIKIVKWLLRVGADPEQRLSVGVSGHSLFRGEGEEAKNASKITIEYAGHNSMSLAIAWLKQMEPHKGGADWTTDEEYLKNVISLLSASKISRGADVTVPQSTFSLWESMRDLTASHNVIFESSDGEVTAHDQILVLASPVLKAMLETAMKEGTSRRIQVKDSSSSGISLFLDLLYTSSTREDPDHNTMLVALDLAHRWNVHGVVQTLCVALRDMIDAESFVAIAEAAALKGLQSLERACASFGAADEKVQNMLKKGSLPAAVRKMLGEADETVDIERLPRKRRLFRSS